MSSKITIDHLTRGAVVYVRQSTMSQVLGNTESKRRQYGLADQARAAGFVSVAVIDEDLGRSGSGSSAVLVQVNESSPGRSHMMVSSAGDRPHLCHSVFHR